MNLNPYGIPALISGLMFVLLIAYVLHKNPKGTQNRVAALFFLSLAIWSFAEMMERFSGPPPDVLMADWTNWISTNTPPPPADWNGYGASLFWGKVIGIGVLLTVPSALHFSLVVPRKRRFNTLVLAGVYVSYFVLVAVLMGTDLFVKTMEPYTTTGGGAVGWGTEYGRLWYVYLGYVMAGVSIAMGVIIYSFVKAGTVIERSQTGMILLGMAVTMVLNVATSLIPTILDISMWPLSTVSFIILAGSISCSIGRYNLFEIEAVMEKEVVGEEEKPVKEIRQGFSFLFDSDSPSEAYRAFRAVVTKVPGLCVSTRHPSKIRKDYGLERIPIIWLTDATTKENALSPSRLDFEIFHTIHSFIKENEATAVLLEGMEYLCMVNGTEKALEFMKGLQDSASVGNCSLIAPMDLGIFDERHASLFKGGFDEVVEGEADEDFSVPLEPGYSRLLVDDTGALGFTEAYSLGADGRLMVLSSTFPDKLRKKYDLPGAELYWISDSVTEVRSIGPARIDFELTQAPSDFLKCGGGRVVLLDGMPEILRANELPRVVEYLKGLVDTASEYGGFLVVNLPNGILKPEEVGHVARLFDSVVMR